jgi:hypothetical protein
MGRLPTAGRATCATVTTGPARLPCLRADPHVTGHVWVGSDVPDGTHDDD